VGPRCTRGPLASPLCAAAAAVLTAAVGCGDHPPKTLVAHEPPLSPPPSVTRAGSAPRSEPEKIDWLCRQVEASGYVFLRGRRSMTAGEFADRMREVQRAHRDEIRTAREFIERVGRPGADGRPIRVRTAASAPPIDVRTYLHDRLDDLERGGAEPRTTGGTARPTPRPPEDPIARLLERIERSGATFLVPQRGGPPRRLDAASFAAILAKKWRFLGAGIDDPQTFIDEIASEPYAVFAPYEIVLSDGTTRPVASWLRGPATTPAPTHAPAAPRP